MKYPIVAVNKIWPIPVTSATGPTSLITLGDKCKPTINNKNAIPISEKIVMVSLPWRMSKKKGPTKIPDKIYPMINGCFNNLIMTEIPKTTKIISPNCMNGLNICSF